MANISYIDILLAILRKDYSSMVKRTNNSRRKKGYSGYLFPVTNLSRREKGKKKRLLCEIRLKQIDKACVEAVKGSEYPAKAGQAHGFALDMLSASQTADSRIML